MPDDATLTALLIRIDGVANAPMTAYQRDIRAQGLLAEAGVTVPDIVRAMRRRDLSWNARKAQECGVDVDTWLQAARIVNQSSRESLCDLLERIHQMEAAVSMLRAGYIAGRDVHGRLVWSH